LNTVPTETMNCRNQLCPKFCYANGTPCADSYSVSCWVYYQ